MHNRQKFALFVDVENLTGWIKQDGMARLLDDLSGPDSLLMIRRAYGIWSSNHIHALQAPLNRLGFDLVHSFHPVSGKNSADIQLAMDALETAIRHSDIQHFVLATGDSDFSPLFRRLREMGKLVTGVGPRSPLSECVKTSCSRYIYTDEGVSDEAYERSEAIAVLEKVLRRASEPMPLGALKNHLLSLDNAFDERRWGYSNFSAFIDSIKSITCVRAGNKHLHAQLKGRSTGNAQDASAERYRQMLREMGWHLIPQALVEKMHHALLETPEVDASELQNNLLGQVSAQHRRRLMQGTTTEDIRNTLSIFNKAHLFAVRERQGSTLWRYQDQRALQPVLAKLNQAMEVRIRSACGKAKIGFDSKVFAALLYQDQTCR